MPRTLSPSHKGRIAIRAFKTLSDALVLRGFYKPSGKSGQTLEKALRDIAPEIYGSMNDPRIIELKGLEYVIDRLPRGIENCSRIVLTTQEGLEDTDFEKIIPLKRRRTSYRISDEEICFVITRGLTEVYDILTHLTFLYVEARKIYNRMKGDGGETTTAWHEFDKSVSREGDLSGDKLVKAIWNLSILLGITHHETRDTFECLEKSRHEQGANSGLFNIISGLAKRMEAERQSPDNELLIYFTPSLQDMIGQQRYSESLARDMKQRLDELGLLERPLHIISANMHSVRNLIYGHALRLAEKEPRIEEDLYDFCRSLRDESGNIEQFAVHHGFTHVRDRSGASIDYQIIDTARLDGIILHPAMRTWFKECGPDCPVLLVFDYPFGSQAFEVMDELLEPYYTDERERMLRVKSISVMGKAGILPGKKGDIMLATAHVIEGTADNYMVENDLRREDFDPGVTVYEGPIITVLGTSLQNRDVLERFHKTSWKAVGLEMEGGHYQRAISAAMIRGHIGRDVKVRYAYYASDNPLVSGQTLAAGSMGEEGIKPTYMITKVILEKIIASS